MLSNYGHAIPSGQSSGSRAVRAARAGWLDALAGRPFSEEWQTETAEWQRNYESGRQWAVAVRAAGLTPPDWPEAAPVPQELLQILARIRNMTGSGTRPEDFKERPAPNAERVRAFVPVIDRRGRVVERLTS